MGRVQTAGEVNLTRCLLPAFLCAHIFFERETSGYEAGTTSSGWVGGSFFKSACWRGKLCEKMDNFAMFFLFLLHIPQRKICIAYYSKFGLKVWKLSTIMSAAVDTPKFSLHQCSKILFLSSQWYLQLSKFKTSSICEMGTKKLERITLNVTLMFFESLS